jgi:hypothetical protein
MEARMSASYSPEDIQAVVGATLRVVGGVVSSGDSGFLGSLREIGAVSNFITEVKGQVGENPLLHGVIDSLLHVFKSEGVSVARQDTTTLWQEVIPVFNALPNDQDGYQTRLFIYSLAEHVAQASGGKLFGLGKKISDLEAAYLNNLRTALGI